MGKSYPLNDLTGSFVLPSILHFFSNPQVHRLPLSGPVEQRTATAGGNAEESGQFGGRHRNGTTTVQRQWHLGAREAQLPVQRLAHGRRLEQWEQLWKQQWKGMREL